MAKLPEHLPFESKFTAGQISSMFENAFGLELRPHEKLYYQLERDPMSFGMMFAVRYVDKKHDKALGGAIKIQDEFSSWEIAMIHSLQKLGREMSEKVLEHRLQYQDEIPASFIPETWARDAMEKFYQTMVKTKVEEYQTYKRDIEEEEEPPKVLKFNDMVAQLKSERKHAV